jgi:hypothetical protein
MGQEKENEKEEEKNGEESGCQNKRVIVITRRDVLR